VITFWFDFVSPYSWVAFRPARALAEKHGVPLRAVPVLFAALLDASGNLGPAEVPAKRAFIFKDAYRKAQARGLPPLVLPPAHPFNPLAALRVATASSSLDVVDSLFAAAWIDGRAIDTLDAVAAVVGKELAESANEPATKQRLRENTESAITRGVFGVPTFGVGDELFWGSECIEHVDAFIRGEDPIPRDPAYFERPRGAERKKVDQRGGS
jgi:2-hydroxychromene-2-carboxylate isomerase